jgi:hypothetical protein
VPCAQAPYGIGDTCDEYPCPPGQRCVPNPKTGTCRCVPEPCEYSPIPECDGPCPQPGEACMFIPKIGKCRCRTFECASGPYPDCDGTCPPGFTCIPGPPGVGCTCVKKFCGDTFPQCDGTCPINHGCRHGFLGGCYCCPNGPPDGGVGIAFASKAKIVWPHHPCGGWYHVYKTTLQTMQDLDGDGVADDYGTCQAHDLTEPEYTDPEPDPAPGFMDVYVVTVGNENGEGSKGSTSAGLPRPNLAPCP